MPLFQDDIMREFGQGVADIESEKTRKKRRPLVSDTPPATKGRDPIADFFDIGVKEIEQAGIKETPLIPAVGRAIATIPPHISPILSSPTVLPIGAKYT